MELKNIWNVTKEEAKRKPKIDRVLGKVSSGDG